MPQATAIVYFKRFYTINSCLECDPARTMPVCIYLAAKVNLAQRLHRVVALAGVPGLVWLGAVSVRSQGVATACARQTSTYAHGLLMIGTHSQRSTRACM